jgi:UDP-4-amino-4,6-dideoxy-N-acetyl-beta-L-altrosamine transaminase
MIAYGRQDIQNADIEAVIETLRSDYLTQGPQVTLFEKKLSEYCGVDNVVVCNSATSALHVACLSLGVTRGDIVWTSPISFVASSNCALYCDASVDFVDIDPITYNISTEALLAKLQQAKKDNKLPKVIIPVHLAGLPCDLKTIKQLSLEFGFKIIEDASHAIGGSYEGSKIGSCRYSDITVFSFHPVKIITTGEGGACATNSSDLAKKMRLLISHGITRDELLMENESHGPWYYEQIDLGFNYRITDIQCALGLSQLCRIDDYISKRNEIALIYNDAFQTKNYQVPHIPSNALSAFHLYILRVKNLKKSKKDLFIELRQKGVGVNLHYMPIYKQPYYQRLGFNYNYLPESERYYNEALTLPIHPLLSNEDIKKVIQAIVEVTI